MFTYYLNGKDYIEYGKDYIMMHINNITDYYHRYDRGARTTKSYSSSTNSSVSQLGME